MSQTSTSGSLDDKVLFSDAPGGKHNKQRRGKKKVYKKYNNNDVIMEALAFYILPHGMTLSAYYKMEKRRVPMTTMK